MFWPLLTALLILAGAALHLWWRRRFHQAQQQAQSELLKLQESHDRAAHQVQTQQEALFDSMAEGLLLLDENGRVQLANRAFNRLFGVTCDIRSRTIIEALRLHEL